MECGNYYIDIMDFKNSYVYNMYPVENTNVKKIFGL